MNSHARLRIVFAYYVAVLFVGFVRAVCADEVDDAIQVLKSRDYHVVDVGTDNERAFVVIGPIDVLSTDDDLKLIAALGRVRKLLLLGCEGVTNDGIGALGAIKELNALYLLGMNHDIGIGISRLRDVAGLRDIDLLGLHVGKQPTVDALADLPELERLHLWGCTVTDEGLRKIATISTLRELDDSATKVTDEGISLLATLPELRVLDLGGLSSDRLCLLSKCAKLRKLYISVDEDGWADAIRAFPSLTRLSISGTLTAANCADLELIDGLEELTIQSSDVEDGVADQIVKCRNLERLTVSGRGLNPQFFARLSRSASLRTIESWGNLRVENNEIGRMLPLVSIVDRFNASFWRKEKP